MGIKLTGLKRGAKISLAEKTAYTEEVKTGNACF